eukprot:6210988-Pleurochrysis_carterae.AAC.1
MLQIRQPAPCTTCRFLHTRRCVNTHSASSAHNFKPRAAFAYIGTSASMCARLESPLKAAAASQLWRMKRSLTWRGTARTLYLLP